MLSPMQVECTQTVEIVWHAWQVVAGHAGKSSLAGLKQRNGVAGRGVRMVSKKRGELVK